MTKVKSLAWTLLTKYLFEHELATSSRLYSAWRTVLHSGQDRTMCAARFTLVGRHRKDDTWYLRTKMKISLDDQVLTWSESTDLDLFCSPVEISHSEFVCVPSVPDVSMWPEEQTYFYGVFVEEGKLKRAPGVGDTQFLVLPELSYLDDYLVRTSL